jgi:ammonium transporter Rh
MEKAFAAFFLLFTAAMIAVYGGCTEYIFPSPINPGPGQTLADTTLYRVIARYMFLQDIRVMIFVGFGFLMAFMHRAGFTATGHAFLAACYSILWAILNRGFWERAIGVDRSWTPIQLTVVEFIGAHYTAAAILVSFGALLGRVTASQLLMMALIEVIVYSINEAILIHRFETVDHGRSMSVHVFGALFGLTTSFVLEMVRRKRNLVPNLAGSTRITDTLAMVGTLFLFCFWPSYNAALVGQSSQDRAITNTILAITTSCLFAFFFSCLIDARGRFGMADVQNATLAGGIAMGSAAAMVVNPYGAMIVGALAGMVATVGYRLITPMLERCGLRDTCGVMNMHLLPGVLAAVVSAIAAGAARQESYIATYGEVFVTPSRDRDTQAGYQMAGLGTSIGFALVGGAIAGAVLAAMPVLPAFFDDVYEYLVPDEHQGTLVMTVQKVNEPVAQQHAPGSIGTVVSATHSTTTTAPMTWAFTNAPSATEHGATIFPAQPLVLTTSENPDAVRPYGALRSETAGADHGQGVAVAAAP